MRSLSMTALDDEKVLRVVSVRRMLRWGNYQDRVSWRGQWRICLSHSDYAGIIHVDTCNLWHMGIQYGGMVQIEPVGIFM